jgi:hypothetical protein
MNRIYGTLIGILFFSLSGCGTSFVNTGFTCLHADEGHIGPDGTPDPCHYQDCPACATASPYADLHVCLLSCPEPLLPGAGGPAEDCDGTCAPVPSKHWTAPSLHWRGLPGDERPVCPEEMGDFVEDRYTDPIFPNQCTCDCVPPAGSCSLPSSFSASTAICSQGGTSISFEAPVNWDGSCTADNPIPASTGVKSLTIAPLTMTEGSCQPDLSKPPTSVPVTWQGVAGNCRAAKLADCNNNTGFCVANPPPSSKFLMCISHEGDVPCEPGPYTDRYVTYKKGTTPMDRRNCSSCSCGKPVGSKCAAQVSLYQNNICVGAPLFSFTAGAGVVPDPCFDLPVADAALMSKSATPPVYIPGTCSSGTAEPDPDDGAETVCCLREEPPR